VLEQQYNGERIKPGTKINMGSGVTLVLGSGLGQNEFNVPDLFSLTYNEALMMLQSTGLTPGAVIPDPDVTDSMNGYVYKQSPDRYTYDNRINRIRAGQTIDLWLSKEKPVRNIDSTQNSF
jgi:beta-lactam-binding protein with PASTA domain